MLDADKIYDLVAANMLAPAVKMLKGETGRLVYDTRSRIENVEMLCRNYYDYSDDSVLDQIKQTILLLADDIAEQQKVAECVKYEYIVKRSSFGISEQTLCSYIAEPMNFVEIDIDTDAHLILLFRQIWLSDRLSSAAIDMLGSFLGGDSDLFARRVAIAAIMLRAIRYYDIRLVELLAGVDLPDATVAIAMILLARARRISADAKSMSFISSYLADTRNAERFTAVLGYIMRTFETEQIARELRERIYPEVMKKGLEVQNTPGGIENLINENGLNPEWEEELSRSGIIDKMQKINDMQANGADVHFESFQAMKRIPFFADAAHWFYPFDLRHNSVSAIKGTDAERIQPIANMLNLCDSDRYSLFIMLGQMGVRNISQALSGMGLGDIESIREMSDQPEQWQQSDSARFNDAARFAVMNIYRFYKLAPNHADFISPFDALSPLRDTPLLRLLPAQALYNAALILFHNSRYESALVLFNLTVDAYADSDRHIFQKTGFCHQKAMRWAEALAEYNKSDILLPDDIWTLRHIAYCQGRQGATADAAATYTKILSIAPDQADSIFNLAQIYIEADDFARAKPLLYKLDFIRPGTDVCRSLGYTLLRLNESEQADKYLLRTIQAPDASATDFILAAINIFAANTDVATERLAAAARLVADDTRFLALFHTPAISSAVQSRLVPEDRKKLVNTINKIIITQQ